MTKKVAQTASCLAPKIFTSTLSVVRSALFTEPKKDQKTATATRSSKKVTYEDIVNGFGWTNSDFVVECMEDAEETLRNSGELKGKYATAGNKIVTVVVLCWVSAILEVSSPNFVTLPVDLTTEDS